MFTDIQKRALVSKIYKLELVFTQTRQTHVKEISVYILKRDIPQRKLENVFISPDTLSFKAQGTIFHLLLLLFNLECK